MKEGFRQSMSWLHTWGGLLMGWILFFVFLTGTAGYVEAELDRWMRPEKPLVAAEIAQADALALGLKFVQETMPNARRWLVSPPGGREQPELRYFVEGYPESLLAAVQGLPFIETVGRDQAPTAVPRLYRRRE